MDWCVYIWPSILITLISVLLVTPGWRWFYIAGATAKRDFTGMWSYLQLLLLMKKCERKNLTVPRMFESLAREHPQKIAVLIDKQKWTFRELNEFSNRIANTFVQLGYKRGDVVGLMLENRAEYLGIWVGLAKIGVIVPLINTNLRGPSLVHSISVANCKALIYGEDYTNDITNITKELSNDFIYYQFNNEIGQSVSNNIQDLTTLIASASNDEVPENVEKSNYRDKLIYIYTSGTTGLPKAAVITHARYMFIAAATYFALYFRKDDLLYIPLPLYHSAGGILGAGQVLLFGLTIALRKKFSASGYFADCMKFDCTIAQYIGEMARYVLATQPSDNDRKHNVRLMFGNGLRPQIWTQFVERFNIPQIGEFYGATEGNANIINNDNTVGAIGFVSRIMPRIYPVSIIRADSDTGEPIRGPDGLCQVCKAGEPGVFVGKILKGNPAREFLGYVDQKASEKKVVHDVFVKGDMAFISGDILVADEKGYIFFKDRTGDTFRWKGENVSTSEVEAQVSNVAGYKDTVVYGVTIPNTEGRAGMAAIYDPHNNTNLNEFSEKLNQVLPVYARPIFLRFLHKLDITGTFKLRKVDLQKEGFDPNNIDDTLYYLTPKGNYEPLNAEKYDQIIRHEIRF